MLYRDYAVEGRPLPWQGQRGAAVQPGAPAPPASPAARPEASAAPAAAPASVQPAAFADPFRYCAFVDTIDSPDSRYSGPAFTAPIAQAVRAPMSSSPDRVRWRCVDGAVWACSSFDWPVCSITPSVAEMMEFCTRNPGARNLQAPSGSWSCEGTRPVIPPNQNWPVDARGFLPQAWVRVPAPA
jgi:hypothetical protein